MAASETSFRMCAPVLSLVLPKDHIQLPQRIAPTNSPIKPSPTPTWLATAPAVGKVVVGTAATEEVEVEVTTEPGPLLLGSETVLPAGRVESPSWELTEDVGGIMIVVPVAEVAGVVSEGGDGSVTAPVEAVLLWLSVHTVVVTVPMVVGVRSEPEDDETVTLCVKVEAIVAGDEVAVYVGVQTSTGRANVPL